MASPRSLDERHMCIAQYMKETVVLMDSIGMFDSFPFLLTYDFNRVICYLANS